MKKYNVWLTLERDDNDNLDTLDAALLISCDSEEKGSENFEYCQELIFADPRYTPEGKT